MSLEALRQQLAEIVLPPAADGPGVATGLAELDEALPGGGMPRGRLTEVVGVRGSGKTTLIRRLVESAAAEGLWVAYVDADRTLAPQDWAHLGEGQGVWMIRPRDPARGAWCADVLLRSGAFSLVILDGAPRLTRQVAVRLTRLARESDAALVAVGEESGGSGTMLGGAVRLRVAGKRRRRPEARGPRPEARGSRLEGATSASRNTQHATRVASQFAARTSQFVSQSLLITIEKGGTYRTVEVSCAIGVASRLCTHPEVPDRRGVARGGGARGVAGAAAPAGAPASPHADGAAGADPASRVLPRSRRCAEPEYGRERGVSRALRIAIARARSV